MKYTRYILLGLLFYAQQTIPFTSGISISPTRLDISKTNPITTLTIKNNTEKSVAFQVIIKRWSQKNQINAYSDTDYIFATPPVFKLSPMKNQLIRFTHTEAFPSSKEELSYRVFVREIPLADDSATAIRRQLNILLQISLPLFVAPESNEVKTKMDWSATWLSHNRLALHLENRSNHTVFINQWRLITKANKHEISKQNTFTYILPGQNYTWSAYAKKTRSPLDIEISSNASFFKSHVHLNQ